MEQRRVSGKSHWYHETQSSTCPAEVLPLVPEAAHVEDRFLLEIALPESLLAASETWIAPARALASRLFPDEVAVSRLNTFSAYDRLSTALTVAQVFGVQRLCNHYAARLAPLPGPDSSRESNHRLAQITQYARQLASSPAVITSQARTQLEDVGLTLPDIVLINQIIGFVGFQARVLATFQAVLAHPARWIPGMPVQEDADADRFADPEARWQTTIRSAEPRFASVEQESMLTKWQSLPTLAGLAPLLVYDCPALEATGNILTALPSDTWTPLVALLSARINGSASRFNEYANDSGFAVLLRQDADALQAWSQDRPVERAIVQAVQLLTRSPDRFSAAHFTPLTEKGLSVQQAVNLLAWSGFCGWLDRLRIALGESVRPDIE